MFVALVVVLLIALVVAGALAARRLRFGQAADPLAGIDPFALSEPWRRFVSDAQKAKRRYADVLKGARPGPLRDRLLEIGARVDDGVRECWQVARSGDALDDARAQVDAGLVRRRVADLEARTDEATLRTVEAMRAQLASAERLDATIASTRDQLRLLDARMDEAVTRAAELAVSADSAAIEGLSNDVDGIVGDLEALRLGLEATSGPT